MLNRFRNLTILLLVIFAQLVLLAYQVKTGQDVRLIRVWAVTAITPLARVLEGLRSGSAGFIEDYLVLVDVREENKRLRHELGDMKLRNQTLTEELSTAERVRALQIFQQKTPSRTVAARIIANGTGANSKVVFIDRGSTSGVQRGMPVITPDGIVGKVLASYPTASIVMLITDSTFAAGVISQKNRVHGTVRGQGHGTCKVDYVQNEEKVDQGEWFYTSGDDRIFPKGLPVGQVTVVRPGPNGKEIYVVPSGLQNGIEEVLVITEGVHQPIPELQTAAAPVYLQSPPPADPNAPQAAEGNRGALETDGDRLLQKYRAIGSAEGHVYGDPGKPPDFNVDPSKLHPAPSNPPAAGAPGQAATNAPNTPAAGAAAPRTSIGGPSPRPLRKPMPPNGAQRVTPTVPKSPAGASREPAPKTPPTPNP